MMTARPTESKIDKRQLRTLLYAAWKNDLRGSSRPMKPSGGKSAVFPPIVGVLLMYGFTGAFLAVFTFIGKNPFVTSFLVFSILALLLAMTILLEFSNLILSPDDYQFVAPLPVGSKTFFAAKLIHLLAYVNILGLIVYFPSAVSVSFANGNFFLLLSYSAAGLLAATTIGMVFIVLYTLILKIVDRETMQHILGYLQLLMICFFYFGYFVAPRLIGKGSLGQLGDFTSSWIYLAPPAWFAAIAKLPSGRVTPVDIGTGLLAIGLLLWSFRAGMLRLSLDYAHTLSNIIARQKQTVFERKRGVASRLMDLVSSPEDRAVWRLIRKQFKYDNRYKMSILTVVPLTAVYIYMGISEGRTIVDPFQVSPGAMGPRGNFLLYFAAAILPFLVVMGTVNSTSYRSAWVFFTSPADRVRIVLSSTRFALVFFCTPYILLLMGLFTWFFGNFLHAFLHCLIVYGILMILTKIMVLFYPRIPFSQSAKTGQRNFTVFIALFLAMPIMVVPMSAISAVGYGGYKGYSVILSAVAIVHFVFYAIVRKTIPKRVERLEFEV